MGSTASSPLSLTTPPGRTIGQAAHSSQHGRSRPPLFRKGVQMTAAHVLAIDRAEGVCRNWDVTLLCWQCGAPLAELTPDTRTGSGIRTCQRCKMTTQYRNGIWGGVAPHRPERFLE